MKEIEIKLWELTQEEASKLKADEQMLIYNPLMDTFRIERGGKGNLATHKHLIPQLKFFTFKEPNNETEI